jgi:ABC-type transport system involved in multi-copper enzyme maturation permease subunit
MEILGAIPQFHFLQPYLFPSKFMEWTNFLRSPVQWTPVIKALINFAVWIVGTTGLAYWRFRTKDVTS